MSETNASHFIEWEAPEFREYDKTFSWYIVLCIIVFLLAAYQAITADYFGAICMIILGVLIVLFSRRKPQIVTVRLDDEGVSLGSLRVPYKHFQHFWIVDTQDHRTLNLEASTYLKQTIIIELMDQEPNKVRKHMLRHLPEAETGMPSFSQRIAHKLRF